MNRSGIILKFPTFPPRIFKFTQRNSLLQHVECEMSLISIQFHSWTLSLTKTIFYIVGKEHDNKFLWKFPLEIESDFAPFAVKLQWISFQFINGMCHPFVCFATDTFPMRHFPNIFMFFDKLKSFSFFSQLQAQENFVQPRTFSKISLRFRYKLNKVLMRQI